MPRVRAGALIGKGVMTEIGLAATIPTSPRVDSVGSGDLVLVIRVGEFGAYGTGGVDGGDLFVNVSAGMSRARY